MHHLLAWRVSAADATAVDVTPVADSIWAIQNGHFMPQRNWLLQAAYFGAAGPNRARFITPTFRQITTPWIRPVNTDIVPANVVGAADYRANPLMFRALEEIQLEGMQTTGGAAVVVGIAAVSKEPIVPAPQGDIYTLRGTGATTVTAGAWSLITVTWQDTLPAGRYALVGGTFIGATAIAGRCILEEQVDRPGWLGNAAADNVGSTIGLKGGLGVWGQFTGNRFPNVEMLCNAADTAQEIYLDLIKIA